MTLIRTFCKLTIFGITALTLGISGFTPAGAAPSGTQTFGSVDITKVQTQSTRKIKYDADLHTLADRLDTQFRQQTSSVMLTKAEQAELGTLIGKPRQSDADAARVTALQTKASAAAQELTDLQQKKDPSATDSNRLATLTSQYEAGKVALQAVGDGYQAQIRALSDADNAEFTRTVKEAIAASAEQKGLSVVFTSDIAVYTANDITDDVVKRVNK